MRNAFPCWVKPLTPEVQASIDVKELALLREYYAAAKAFERSLLVTGLDLHPFERRCDDADQAIIQFQIENPLRTDNE